MNAETIEQIVIEELKFKFKQAVDGGDHSLTIALATVIKSMMCEEEYLDWCDEN